MSRTMKKQAVDEIRPVICPYCGNAAELTRSTEVYNGRDYGPIWLCRPCEAWVGCHKDSPRHAPLGRLANGELRHAKRAAHKTFDPFWRDAPPQCQGRARKRAYAWLAHALELTPEQTHIGHFDLERCARVEQLCADRRAEPDFSAAAFWSEHAQT